MTSSAAEVEAVLAAAEAMGFGADGDFGSFHEPPRRSTRRRRTPSMASEAEAAAKKSRTEATASSAPASAPSTAAALPPVPSSAAAQPPTSKWADDPRLEDGERIERFKARVLELSTENARLRDIVASLTNHQVSVDDLLKEGAAGPSGPNVALGAAPTGQPAAVTALQAAIKRQKLHLDERGGTFSRRAATTSAGRSQRSGAPKRGGSSKRVRSAVSSGLVLPPGTEPLDFTVVPQGAAVVVLPKIKAGRPSLEEISGSNTVVRCGRRVSTRFGFHGVSMDRRTGVFSGFIGLPQGHPSAPAAKGRPVRCGTAMTPFIAALRREVWAVNVFRMTPETNPEFLWNFAEAQRGWIDSENAIFKGPDPDLLPTDFNDAENVPTNLAPPPAPEPGQAPPTTIPRPKHRKLSQKQRSKQAPKDVEAFFEGAVPGDEGGEEEEEGDLGDLEGMDFDLGDLEELHDEEDIADIEAVAEQAAADFVAEYRAGQAGEEGYDFAKVAAAGLEVVQQDRAARAEGAKDEAWVALAEGDEGSAARRRRRRKYVRRAVHHMLGGPAAVGPVGVVPKGVDAGAQGPKFWRHACRSNTGYYGVYRMEASDPPFRSRMKVSRMTAREHRETTAFRAALAREVEALEPESQPYTCRTKKFRWNFPQYQWVDYTTREDEWRWIGPLPDQLPSDVTEETLDLFWGPEQTAEARRTRPFGSLNPEKWPSFCKARTRPQRKRGAQAAEATEEEGGDEEEAGGDGDDATETASASAPGSPGGEEAGGEPTAGTGAAAAEPASSSTSARRARADTLDLDMESALAALEDAAVQAPAPAQPSEGQ